MPAMPHRLLQRIPLALLAFVQLTIPGGAAWADARLGQSERGPAHIESHPTPACVRLHPGDCALHRFLSAPIAGNRAPVLRVRDGFGHAWVLSFLAVAHATPAAALHRSRAPPALS